MGVVAVAHERRRPGYWKRRTKWTVSAGPLPTCCPNHLDRGRLTSRGLSAISLKRYEDAIWALATAGGLAMDDASHLAGPKALHDVLDHGEQGGAEPALSPSYQPAAAASSSAAWG